MMFTIHGKRKLTALLLVTAMISGCGGNPLTPAPANAGNDTENITAMLEAPEIAYDKTPMHPSILVDLKGYDVKGNKIAVIEAPILPSIFKVVDKESGAIVMSGNVKVRECGEDGEEYTGNADFTGITEPGTYYIEADLIGRSNDFEICENKYALLASEYLKKLSDLKVSTLMSLEVPLEDDANVKIEVSGGWITGEDSRKDVCEACLAIQDILTGMEYFPSAFGDDAGLEYSGNGIPDILDEAMAETEWLFKMQNKETGGVYTAVSLIKDETSGTESYMVMGETTRATAYYCATMARMSYMVKKYDPEFSKRCIEAANISWKCLEANTELVDPAQMFRAATEMYRATGYGVYSGVIDTFLKDNADKEFDGRLVLDGAVVYMSSTRSTNVKYCTTLMENYMSRTEDKSNSARASRYMVEQGDREVSVLLRNLMEIMVADYIISNQEYKNIEEDYVHYMCGRNPECEIYCEGITTPDMYVQFIVPLYRLSLLYADK